MADAPPVVMLAWDTNYWGFPVGRIAPFVRSAAQMGAADAWCKDHGVAVAFLLAPVAELGLVNAATRLGFQHVDLRCTLRRGEADAPGPETPGGALIRVACDADREAMELIAERAHQNTRFYADTRFDRAACDELYRTWIRNSCDGWAQFVLVAEADRSVIGYVTGHGGGEGASIGLVAVDEVWRGLGVGAALVRAAVSRFAGANAGPVRVSTQGSAPSVQTMYQRLAFTTEALEFWLHKWYPPG
jgi:dTDP-4-amino-4,6-dideoxy-D-galactose acyltransferase